MNFKNIHIGSLIQDAVTECGIDTSRICNFFKCSVQDIEQMYKEENLSTGNLLIWSKLLQYDFFTLYTQHLILYAPIATVEKRAKTQNIKLPRFRKNIYTQEIIEFILEQINTGEMSRNQVIERYKIPKTTLYKWISKYRNQEN